MDKQDYKISVLRIFSQAAETLENNKAYYFKVLFFPVLLLIVSSLLFYEAAQLFPEASTIVAWVSVPINWLFYGIFAVTCHRLILFNAHKVQPYSLSLTRTEWLFCVYLVIVGVLAYLLLLLVFMPLLQLFNLFPFAIWSTLVSFLLGVLHTYFFGRFCLIFPSIAIDERISLKQSWIVTRGNSLRILFIIGVIPFFLFLFSSVSDSMEQGTMITYLFDTMWFLVQPIFLALEVFLVSFIYKDIKENWIASVPE